MEGFAQELSSLQAKSGAIEQAIKDLEQKILDIGGSRLLAAKSKVDGTRGMISLSNDEITRAEVARAKAEKDVTKCSSSIQANKTTEAEESQELQSLEEQLAEVNAYVAELREKVEAAREAVDHSKEDLRELKRELDEKTEQIQAFRKIEVRDLWRSVASNGILTAL